MKTQPISTFVTTRRANGLIDVRVEAGGIGRGPDYAGDFVIDPALVPWKYVPLSAARIEAIRQEVAGWLEWSEKECAASNFVPSDDTQIRTLPTNLTHGQIKVWIEEFDRIIASLAAAPESGRMLGAPPAGQGEKT